MAKTKAEALGEALSSAAEGGGGEGVFRGQKYRASKDPDGTFWAWMLDSNGLAWGVTGEELASAGWQRIERNDSYDAAAGTLRVASNCRRA